MKKEWKKPELEVLTISMTMKGWKPPEQEKPGQGDSGLGSDLGS
ncbi:paeninodin family lasso peptide [Peribacillus loiseleuriae]|nr:paeninodin family lasso peptide [Peribacillus loiseleuriae]